MKPVPHPASPGQESVWHYPRPAIAEPTSKRILIVHRGIILAATVRAVRTLETSHPPSYYIPRTDIDMAKLRPKARRSVCEWKGEATYFDVVIEGETLTDIAWSYPKPTAPFASLREHIAFYPGPFDECRVDGEQVTPQPGDFYGGWITSDIVGPFKGIPGSRLW
ncbi:hypothetical protein GCM10011390_26310 [Aureimonas endophytica]|uniref:DUF427 domain-containing protein n=1 Tax=Aureimonas endophytica TaxID=2027858 RepID=A0A916ZNE7_9HYPH|nr:DUF427 domain-containing protein [Aureimonas endophytica]GGE05965.1 hypothetical protein GCM10011390_26310 [Aureimonas endophytica]